MADAKHGAAAGKTKKKKSKDKVKRNPDDDDDGAAPQLPRAQLVTVSATAESTAAAAVSTAAVRDSALRKRMVKAFSRGEPAEAKEETRTFAFGGAAAGAAEVVAAALTSKFGLLFVCVGALVVWRDTIFVWSWDAFGYSLVAFGCFLLFGLPLLSSLSAVSSVVSSVAGGEDEEKPKNRYKFRVWGSHLRKDLNDLNALIGESFKPLPPLADHKALAALIQTAADRAKVARAGRADAAEDDADADADAAAAATTAGDAKSDTKADAKSDAKGRAEKPKAKAKDKPESEKQRAKRVAAEVEAARKQRDAAEAERISAQLQRGVTLRRVQQQRAPKAFVLTFRGDMMASGAHELAEKITLVLAVASPWDVVVLRLHSPGGLVSAYGFAASQLERVRRARLHLTVCVDEVAASGGYMMGCLANTIVAAPFAVVGSIGVVAGIPNVSKVLRRHDIDYHLFTAGKYKRTVEPFAPVTDAGKAKMQEQLEEIHSAFQAHVTRYRPALDLAAVATGEAWLAVHSVQHGLGLVDVLATSDEYLRTLSRTHLCVSVRKAKATGGGALKRLWDLFAHASARLLQRVAPAAAAAAATASASAAATAVHMPSAASAAASTATAAFVAAAPPTTSVTAAASAASAAAAAHMHAVASA